VLVAPGPESTGWEIAGSVGIALMLLSNPPTMAVKRLKCGVVAVMVSWRWSMTWLMCSWFTVSFVSGLPVFRRFLLRIIRSLALDAPLRYDDGLLQVICGDGLLACGT
jgi:hypothetical protein